MEAAAVFEATLLDAPEKITLNVCRNFQPRTFVHASADGTGSVTEFFATARRALQHFAPRLWVDAMPNTPTLTALTLYDPDEKSVFGVTKRVHAFTYTPHDAPPEYVLKGDTSDDAELWVDARIGDVERIRGFFDKEYPGRLAASAKPARKAVYDGPRLFVMTPGDWEIDLKAEAKTYLAWRILLTRAGRRRSSALASPPAEDPEGGSSAADEGKVVATDASENGPSAPALKKTKRAKKTPQ